MEPETKEEEAEEEHVQVQWEGSLVGQLAVALIVVLIAIAAILVVNIWPALKIDLSR